MERVHLFFSANDVQEAKEVAVLLSVVGDKTYSLLRSLVSPTVPKDMTVVEIEAVTEAL